MCPPAENLVSVPIPTSIAHHVFVVTQASTSLLIGFSAQLQHVFPANDFEAALQAARTDIGITDDGRIAFRNTQTGTTVETDTRASVYFGDD